MTDLSELHDLLHMKRSDLLAELQRANTEKAALLEVAEAAREWDALLYGPNEDRTAMQHLNIKVRLEQKLHKAVAVLDSPNVKEGGK